MTDDELEARFEEAKTTAQRHHAEATLAMYEVELLSGVVDKLKEIRPKETDEFYTFLMFAWFDAFTRATDAAQAAYARGEAKVREFLASYEVCKQEGAGVGVELPEVDYSGKVPDIVSLTVTDFEM